VKAEPLLLLLLLLLAGAPSVAPRAGGASSLLPLDLGYAPSLIFPVAGGTPVYSAGDQLWARSHFNSTIEVELSPLLTTPTPAPTYAKSVVPGAPERILTFNSTDPQGLWVLRTVNLPYQELLFVVSDAASVPANLTLSTYRLAGASLELNFTASPSLRLYDASACVLGGADDSAADLVLPTGIGQGHVDLSRSGDALEVEALGPGSVDYTISAELYRSFSFLVPNSTSTLVSRMARVAVTGSEPLSGGKSVSLTLQHDLPLVPGTYEVRAFFHGTAGVFLAATDVLISGDRAWTWLGGCAVYPVYSDRFSLSVPIGADPASWPRGIWLSYHTFGAEGVAHAPLSLQLAAVDFLGAPWGAKLVNYRIAVNYTSGVQGSSVANGTIYAVLGAQQARVGYRAGLGGHLFFAGAADMTPFARTTVLLNVSRLIVQYLVRGSGYGGGTVHVSDSTGLLARGTTDSSGRATFYLPSGEYNLTASGGNSSASGVVSVLSGKSEEVVLGGTGAGGFDSATVAGLAVAAAVGLAANVAVWARGRRRRLAGQSSPSQK
jgi:hypothetical protein